MKLHTQVSQGILSTIVAEETFHVACVAQLRVSFLILYKDSFALPFHHFVWYWFKVGRQFVATTLV